MSLLVGRMRQYQGDRADLEMLHTDNTAYVLGQIPLMTLQTKGKL